MDRPIPQEAPWSAGTRLKYIGDHCSGFTDDDGKTIWSHRNGVAYEVVRVRPAGPNTYRAFDYDANENYWCVDHGWSVLRSDLDPDGKHEKAIDIESMHDYELVRSVRRA